mmetsp:Transcript_6984/g.9234  ORF Transcript_6984/g.9234 Transcript_6984/m.9234 type:complete len:554 (+) Transcript_6984:56-1717(+)
MALLKIPTTICFCILVLQFITYSSLAFQSFELQSPQSRLSSNKLVMMAKKKKGGKKAGNPELEKALETYEPVIGVEVHTQLNTETKAYCNCGTSYSPEKPNTNICPVCMGEPGTLPIPNKKVVEIAAKTGMALNCKIAHQTKFDRKNYYYPDTPKNYQITQYDYPICEHGELELPSGKKVGITRLHMEEDSAKMNHQGSDSLSGSTHSFADFNRAGIPLAEIVSEPDMRSGAEAAEYGRELQRVLRYLGSSDGNMAEGSLRLDINVSIRPKGSDELRTKVELKNLNSFKAVQQSIDYEIVRQFNAYEAGETIRQETRLWDEKELVSKIMRVKEGESDYRYFPEPDIPPINLSEETIEQWRSDLCELPAAKRHRYQSELGLDSEEARVLTDDQQIALYYEKAVEAGANPKEAAKWLIGDIAGHLAKQKKTVVQSKMTPESLAEMVTMIASKKITGKIAKELLADLLDEWEASPSELVSERGMEAITDPKIIEGMVREIMNTNQDKVEQYRGGKTKLAGFFLGQVMAKSGSRADPEQAQKIAMELLNEGVEEPVV